MVNCQLILKDKFLSLDFEIIKDKSTNVKKFGTEYIMIEVIFKKLIDNIKINIDYVASVSKVDGKICREHAIIEFRSKKFGQFIKKLNQNSITKKYVDTDLLMQISKDKVGGAMINFVQDKNNKDIIKQELFEINSICKVLAKRYIYEIELFNNIKEINDFLLYSIFSQTLLIEQFIYLLLERGWDAIRIEQEFNRKYIYNKIDKTSINRTLDAVFFNECYKIFENL